MATTLTIWQTLNLETTYFPTAQALYDVLYEEMLEEKMQKAHKEWVFLEL